MSYALNFLKMDNINRLLDATEHPEHYSEAEIEAMLQTTEVKEAFDILDKTKSSLQPVITPDVEAEWKRFEQKNLISEQSPRFRIIGLFTRNIAASVAVGLASLTAVAAVVGIGGGYFRPHESDTTTASDIQEANGIIVQPDTAAVVGNIGKQLPETIVFNNETLETIISQIAGYYGYDVKSGSDSSMSLRLYFRWDQSLPVEEVIERLNNFEQIRLTVIDRTIKIG